MSKCDRCGRETNITTMSRFNTEIICANDDDSCKQREIKHPLYKEAAAAELSAVRAGERNFPGIGCPDDLYPGGGT